MKLVFGEKQVTRPVAHRNDADNIWGDSWQARREDGGYVLDYATGDHAGSHRRLVISAEEFERLRADAAKVETVIRAHGG